MNIIWEYFKNILNRNTLIPTDAQKVHLWRYDTMIATKVFLADKALEGGGLL